MEQGGVFRLAIILIIINLFYGDVSAEPWAMGAGKASPWSDGTFGNMTEDLGDHCIKIGFFADNYDDGNENNTETADTWVVTNGTLKETTGKTTTQQFAVNGGNLSEVTCQANIMVTDTGPVQAGVGGLYVDKWNNYHCFLEANEDFVGVFGDGKERATADANISTGTWYNLMTVISANGSKKIATCYLNGQEMISWTDITGTLTGRLALMTKKATDAYFDDFRCYQNNLSFGDYVSAPRDAGAGKENMAVEVLFQSKPAATSCELYTDKNDSNFTLIQTDISNSTSYTIPATLRNRTYRVRLACNTKDPAVTPSIKAIVVYEGESDATPSDTTPPNITIHSPLNQTTGSSKLLLNVTFDEVIDTAWYVVDGGPVMNLTHNTSNITTWLPYLTDGTHNVTVYANDSSGNLASKTVYFVVDTTPPKITFNIITETTGNYTFINVSLNEIPDFIILEWNGTNMTMEGSGKDWFKNITDLANGYYEYRVWANDSYGNMNGSPMRNITINQTDPRPEVKIESTLEKDTGSVKHGITITDISFPEEIAPGKTIGISIILTSNIYETDVILTMDLPEGWAGLVVQPGSLKPGENIIDASIFVPEGAQGEFAISLTASGVDFIGSDRSEFTMVVEDTEEGGTPVISPVSAAVETSIPARPVKFEVPPQDGGVATVPLLGIFGPGLIVALCLIPAMLIFRRYTNRFRVMVFDDT